MECEGVSFRCAEATASALKTINDLYYFNQFSILRPAIRSKCFVLFVINLNPFTIADAAIKISASLMIRPNLYKSAQILDALIITSSVNGTM